MELEEEADSLLHLIEGGISRPQVDVIAALVVGTMIGKVEALKDMTVKLPVVGAGTVFRILLVGVLVNLLDTVTRTGGTIVVIIVVVVTAIVVVTNVVVIAIVVVTATLSISSLGTQASVVIIVVALGSLGLFLFDSKEDLHMQGMKQA